MAVSHANAQEIRQRRWGPQKEALSAGAYWLEPVSVFQEAGARAS